MNIVEHRTQAVKTLEATFSFFNAPIQTVLPAAQLCLRDAYSYITGDKAKPSTLQLRTLKDTNDAKKFKATHFDFCTFSGVFSRRKADALISHSGLICFDFDHIADVENLKRTLLNDPHFITRLAFRSPSGDGLKWIISMNVQIASHSECFTAVSNYLRQSYQIEVDKSGRDVSRACFLPHDPEAYLNDSDSAFPSLPFAPTEWLKPEQPISSNYDDIERIVEKIEVSRTDITGDYAQWRNIGFALADALSESGRHLFHRISQFYSRYKIEECDAQYDKCVNANGQGITIRTFFYLAEKAGIRFAKSERQSAKTNESAKTALEVCEGSKVSADEDCTETSIAIPPMTPISTMIDSSTLPALIQEPMSHAISDEDEDLLLLGALIAYSSCLPNVYGIYDSRRVYANLYAFVTAPASSGKGRISLSKNLIMPIHNRMREQNKKEWISYKKEMRLFRKRENAVAEEAPEEPAIRALFVPGNSSSTAVYELLDNNGGRGIIFETEGDILTQAFRTDTFNFANGLRKAFHHESISYQRRKDHEYVELQSPQLSVLISGTPQQAIDFIPSVEDGLFCRFIFYYMELNVKWRNVFDTTFDEPLDDTFLAIGEQFLTLYDALGNSKAEHRFVLTQAQVKYFNEVFEEQQASYLQSIGISSVATIRRMGLITFRISMILTVLRLNGNEVIPHKLICSDIDFQNAMTMARIFLQHTAYLLQRFPKLKIQDDSPIKAQKQRQLFASLPNEFNKQIWNAKATAAGINLKTAERYLPKWCDMGILIKIEKDHYQKAETYKLQ